MTQAQGQAVGAGAFSCAKDGSDRWNFQRDRHLVISPNQPLHLRIEPQVAAALAVV